MAERDDPDAPDLQMPFDRRHGAGEKPAGAGLDGHPVVADEGREAPDEARLDKKPVGKGRLAAARRAADQDATLVDDDAARMQARSAQSQPIGLSRTVKRAPRRRGSPSAPTGPGRFSARIVPLCASTICREIESPSPEFWPKPCSGRSV